MRMNTPVTNVEYELKENGFIVSKTDLSGNIQYVNPYFIEVSGFSEDELMGAPQNIVRHPDMPREAFADLWATIKTGMPWTGLVKNRCKNGDHYWVLANVTPVIEDGKPVGYMSVRTKPSRAQINEADQLYRRFRDGHARGLAIRQGKVVRTGLSGKLAQLADLKISTRLAAGMGSLCVLILGIGGAGLASGSSLGGWLGAGMALGVAVCLYLWYSLHQSIVAPLMDATRVARAISGGDLATNFATNHRGDMGQLLRSLQQMNANLRAIIGDVRSNVESINIATREIASGNMDLSSRTEAQASSLEETASSMEEFSSTVKQNADNALQASTLAESASEVALKGGEVVKRVTSTMSEISESANKIVDIISLIDGIAFQTNILALNAAVEAARAGEQGRGFAVVATEVRNLAQRSAGAAKEIKDLIGVSVEKVEIGAKLVNEAGRTMEDIVSSVSRVTTIINDISQASQEQSAGIGQVNTAITQMDEVTQQNAALVEEAAAAAASLETQAGELAQAVSVFKLSRNGSVAAAVASRKPPMRSISKAPPAPAARQIGASRPAGRTRPSNRAPAPATSSDWEEF